MTSAGAPEGGRAGGGTAMTVCRSVALVAMLIVPVAANAQSGGMPGVPGVPREGFGPTPQPSWQSCQQLLALRDEAQKHGMAIQKANQRKATVQEACRLFRSYLSVEVKFLK